MEPTSEPGSEKVILGVQEDAFCYNGPGEFYGVEELVAPGQYFKALAINADANWVRDQSEHDDLIPIPNFAQQRSCRSGSSDFAALLGARRQRGNQGRYIQIAHHPCAAFGCG